MGIESFFTPTTGQPLQTTAAASGAKTQNSGAANKDALLNFFDMILANMQAGETEAAQAELTAAAEKEKLAAALSSDNPLLEKKPALDMERLLADNPEIRKEMDSRKKSTGVDGLAALQQVLGLNKQAFDATLKAFETGMPNALAHASENALSNEKARANVLENAQGKNPLTWTPDAGTGAAGEGTKESFFEKLLNSLQSFAQSPETNAENPQTSDEGTPAEAHMTSAQITQILAAIIIPPAQAGQNFPSAQTADEATVSESSAIPSEDEIAAQLNSLVVGETEESPAIDSKAAQNKDPMSSGKYAEAPAAESESSGTTVKQDAQAAAETKKPDNISSPVKNSAIPGMFQTAGSDGAASASGMMTAAADDGTTQSLGQTGAWSVNAAHTNTITQPVSAGHSHPAVQTVALNIQKMASNGENKNISIQLDPPELGRVEVRMSFGKDKSVKTVLMVEKPETMALLQKDSQALERALQSAGLESDGGLSFELAQDGQSFGHNGGHDGSRNQARYGGSEQESSAIETSTMTWLVDSESGHVRYSITA